MDPYQSLYPQLIELGLNAWLPQIKATITTKLAKGRHGNMAKWQMALAALPCVTPQFINLQDKVEIGLSDDLSVCDRKRFIRQLKNFKPWRKGPYHLFGVIIDAEWRSDWKWQRVLPHIQPLAGRKVLDVGSGNGYHGWRMAGQGAKLVIGIDPLPLVVMQYQLIQQYINADNHYVLPISLEEMPIKMGCFDTVFSMGVLYHCRSPLDHLYALRRCLRAGGELVLETLVIDGEKGMALLPDKRYAKMKNVWFIPSVATMIVWLKRCGFNTVSCVDQTTTTTEEQRITEWMQFESLADFLHPDDSTKTIEGHPGPLRSVFIAKAPA